MQLRGIRRALVALALAAPLPLALAGCKMPGFGSAAPAGSPSPSPSGGSWVVVVTGSPTPSATVRGKATASPLPFISLPPIDPACAQQRTTGQVLVPVAVASGPRSITVTWPRYGTDSGYRIAAVPQRLVNGAQPAVRWQRVSPGAGCTVTGTISGLTSAAPYVVWLDAPDTGHLRDGSRLPYSGRSGVVYPR